MLQKFKCFFGFHNWRFDFYSGRYGFAIGDHCECGVWADDSLKAPWPKECEFDYY